MTRISNYKGPVAASYEYDESGNCIMIIRMPYNPSFIKEFKEVVPYSCRRWDPERKLWIITDIDFTEDVLDLIAQYFPNFDIGDI